GRSLQERSDLRRREVLSCVDALAQREAGRDLACPTTKQEESNVIPASRNLSDCRFEVRADEWRVRSKVCDPGARAEARLRSPQFCGLHSHGDIAVDRQPDSPLRVPPESMLPRLDGNEDPLRSRRQGCCHPQLDHVDEVKVWPSPDFPAEGHFVKLNPKLF